LENISAAISESYPRTAAHHPQLKPVSSVVFNGESSVGGKAITVHCVKGGRGKTNGRILKMKGIKNLFITA
jgi:hypothetical protein